MLSVWNAYPLWYMEDDEEYNFIECWNGVLYYKHNPFKIKDYVIYIHGMDTVTWESLHKSLRVNKDFVRLAQVDKDKNINYFNKGA